MPQTKSKLPIVVLSFVNLILVLSSVAMWLVPALMDGIRLQTLDIIDLCVEVGCALLFVIVCFLINKAPGINFIPEAIIVAYTIGIDIYYSIEYGLFGGYFFIYSFIYVGFVIIYGLAMNGKFGYSAAGKVLIIIFGILRIAYSVFSSFRLLNMRDLAISAPLTRQIIVCIKGILIVITMIMCVFHAARKRSKPAVQPAYQAPAAYAAPAAAPVQPAAQAAPATAPVQPVAQAAPAAQPVQAQYPVERDESSFGYGVLSFLFPLVGLILYLVWHDTTPLKAKSCGLGAIIGFISGVVLTIILVALYVLLIMSLLN
jgi:hypothetical protein